MFINRDDIDFGLASDLTPVQEWSLVEDPSASVEYTTRVNKFQSVSSLTLHFNGGAPSTRIYYVGLRGESMLRTAGLSLLRARCRADTDG